MEGGRSFGRELVERPRATAQEALQPNRYAPQALPQEDVAYVAQEATRNGTIAGIAAAFISSGAVYLANSMSPKFRGGLGISGKMALVVTPTAGAFFLRSHQMVHAAQKRPDEFFSGKPVAAPPEPQHQLEAWQGAANFVYINPFKVIGSIAVPLYGLIFYKESTSASTASLPLSQRLIHTRVYGQMIAVLSTVSVMGFVKSMDAEGIYRIENGRLVRGEPTAARLRQWYSGMGDTPAPCPRERAGAKDAPARTDEQRARTGAAAGTAASAPPDAAERAKRAEARRLEVEREMEVAEAEARGMGSSLLVPLLYAPVVPLMRVALRGRVAPERLTQLTLGVIAVGLLHAGSIMFTDSSVAMRR